MADERTEQNDQEETDSSETTDKPVSGSLTPSENRPFSPTTASEHAYVRRQVDDARKAAVKEFRESDDYKTLQSRARRANELEAQGRQELEELQAAVAKAQSERAGALAMAESALRDVQIISILTQRGVPAERHLDAIALMDKSGIKVNLSDASVTGAEDAVQQLVETKSYLVGHGVAPQQTNAPRPVPNLNAGVTSTPVTEEARIAQTKDELRQIGFGRI